MLETSRRSFITGVAAVFAAPAIVRASSLMPIKVYREKIRAWLPCDGRMLYRADYPDLFRTIGTLYGGDPTSGTFHLPDLRGRIETSPLVMVFEKQICAVRSDAEGTPAGTIVEALFF